MDTTLFKEVASPEAPPSITESKVTEESPLIESSNEPLPSERTALGRDPLLVEALKLDALYGTFDTKELTLEIDRFINGEVNRQHLKNDSETYQKLVDTYSKKLGLEAMPDIYTKLEKLVRYTRVQQRLLDTMREHDELLTADPMTLSASKLKQYLEARYGATAV